MAEDSEGVESGESRTIYEDRLMLRQSRYTILDNPPDGPLIIRDLGPWDQYLSVTNDAEAVVQQLFDEGLLPHGRAVMYYDSEGDLSMLCQKEGMFKGFKAVS